MLSTLEGCEMRLGSPSKAQSPKSGQSKKGQNDRIEKGLEDDACPTDRCKLTWQMNKKNRTHLLILIYIYIYIFIYPYVNKLS